MYSYLELIVYKATYCTAKHGLVGFHESLHYELNSQYKGSNIKTTLVFPGHITTKLFQKFIQQSQFLTPSIDPIVVAKLIIDDIENHRNSDIFVPFYSALSKVYHLVPMKLRRWLFDYLGANNAAVEWIKNK